MIYSGNNTRQYLPLVTLDILDPIDAASDRFRSLTSPFKPENHTPKKPANTYSSPSPNIHAVFNKREVTIICEKILSDQESSFQRLSAATYQNQNGHIRYTSYDGYHFI